MNCFDEINRLPHAAIALQEGRITEINPHAHRLLPLLAVGDSIPEGLEQAPASGSDTGIFAHGGTEYWFSRTVQDGAVWVLFHPAPQTAVTGPQMEGFLRQLRQLQGDFLAQYRQMSALSSAYAHPEEDLPRQLAAFRQNFYQMFRAVTNLEFLCNAAEEKAKFSPVAVDLVGLCSRLSIEAGDLLSRAGVVLDFRCQSPSLLIPGDPRLLERMLLNLLSNGAQHTRDGRLSLRVARRGTRAVILLTQSGVLTDRQMDDLLSQPSPSQIALPGQGAGLGMPVVRQIVALHGGALFVERQEGGLLIAVSLPAGPLDLHAEVRTPFLVRDGGLPALLVELADVLPPELFDGETLE